MPYELDGLDLYEFLLHETEEKIQSVIEDIHPADILEIISEHKDMRQLILNKLPYDVIAAIVDEAEDEEKYELLTIFPERDQKEIIDEMSSDELVDLLTTIPEEEAQEILIHMDKEDAEEVRELLTYDSDSAGGIMATEYVAIKEQMTIEETLRYLRKEAPDAETAYYIYVLDSMNYLKGVVSLRDLVISDLDIQIKDIMNENVLSVLYSMDQEEVGHIFQKYGFSTIPVIDENGIMLGIVTVDDIMNILQEENTEDIYRLAGLQENEKVSGSIRDSAKKRLPWLLVNLITASLASSVITFFQGTLDKAVALAAFMPIVAGLGGNVGTQTLTMIVRGIALGELNFDNAKKIFFKEISVGVIMGVTLGGIMALIAGFYNTNPYLGIVIGLSMILNMTVATFAGFIVPFMLKKMKVDPALASSIFVTMCTDMLGFFFFLGLSTLFISYLV